MKPDTQPDSDANATAPKATNQKTVVQAMKEAEPSRDDVEKFTYAPSDVDAVYPKDYTGLPGLRE